MNRYPFWKYILILVIVAVGFVYALPNIYPPDPAIQISGISATLQADENTLKQAEAALRDKGIDIKAAELNEGTALIRLKTRDAQLTAREAVQERLGQEQYVVAVNLAPTTPDWLLSLGAGPMKLGLDLAGGVHFLLEVDTDKILRDEFESIGTQIRKEIRDKRLFGVKASIDNNALIVSAENEELRQKMTQFLRDELSSLEYQKYDKDDKYFIRAVLKESFIREKEDFAVNQNLSTLRNRVNEIGVSEPIVQRHGKNRIVVELPGIQDTARAKVILGKTANLEFRLEAKPNELKSQTEKFDFRNEVDQGRFGGATLEKKKIIGGDKVTHAQVSYDPDTGLPQVSITLDSDGGDAINRDTRNNVGRRMGVLFIEYKTREQIVVDENGEEEKKYVQVPTKSVISLATIQGALGRSFRITGLDSPAEASELALLLRAGALAAPMGFVEERTIGPSLGAENIAVGVKSVQIGLVAVMIFMLFYYRVFGFAANIALTVNLVLLIAVMSVLGATLTLPGIAGIVLTVGMAVDANVLIFSRIREELKEGSSPPLAIKSGFERAFETILDANLTTFIVAIILYAIGSGPIKGFAVTLAIGILTSMFTAIMGTRAIVNTIYGGKKVKKLWI